MPKDHAAKHVPAQFKRDGFSIDTFVNERYHIQKKSVAQHIRNTQCFEKSLLGRMVMNHVRLTNAAGMFRDVLLPPISVSLELATSLGVDEAHIASSMRWRGTQLSAGDLLKIDGVPHTIHVFFVVGGDFAAITSRCSFGRQVTSAAAEWRPNDNTEFVLLRGCSILLLSWTVKADGAVLVVGNF